MSARVHSKASSTKGGPGQKLAYFVVEAACLFLVADTQHAKVAEQYSDRRDAHKREEQDGADAGALAPQKSRLASSDKPKIRVKEANRKGTVRAKDA